MNLKFQAFPFKQGKVQMYFAVLRLKDLEHLVVDTYEPLKVAKKRGYQRKPEEKRIRSITKYLSQANAIMPVAGLLNVREKGKMKFNNGYITIYDAYKIWVVDMQHRFRGLLHAYEEGILENDKFSIPVVITDGLSQIEEAAQFYIINTKAKKMDVALTRRLLIENKRVKDVSDVKPWEIKAVVTTIALEKNAKSIWHNRIRQPNQEKLETHIATEKSFVSSLRNIFIVNRKGMSPKSAAKKLNKIWLIIESIIPEAFEEPKSYLIQKTPGIFVFNFFIIPRLLNKSDAEIKRKLSGLKKLGPRFWSKSNKRGVRRFGQGMGGFSNLHDFISGYIK